MKVVVQRVASASVSAPGEQTARIGPGLLLLTGFGHGDGREQVAPTAQKIANLRIFADEQGRFARSLLELQAAVLVVPNFTLYADCTRGRRPDLGAALEPDMARELFLAFVEEFVAAGVQQVESGFFGANMQVELVNDGPVTLVLESA